MAIADDLLTPEQAAPIIKVSAERVRQFCRDGRLGQRFGENRWLISAREAQQFAKIPRRVGNPGCKSNQDKELKNPGK